MCRSGIINMVTRYSLLKKFVIGPHALPQCSVHFHLLQDKVGAVFEEGWHNSMYIATGRIIIIASPGAALYSQTSHHVALQQLLKSWILFVINITSVKVF